MVDLHIRHRTVYRYRYPVTLEPHRLMLRPRENRDVRLVTSNLTLTPGATLSWASDVFGNAVATATFSQPSDTLVIESVAQVVLSAAAYPVFPIAASAISYPFRYSDDE